MIMKLTRLYCPTARLYAVLLTKLSYNHVFLLHFIRLVPFSKSLKSVFIPTNSETSVIRSHNNINNNNNNNNHNSNNNDSSNNNKNN